MESPREPEASLSTKELLNVAVDQTKHLVRAELVHAKLELKSEVRRAAVGGALAGAAGAFAVAGLAAFFLAFATLLPWAEWVSFLVCAGALFTLAGGLGFLAWRRVPKQPMARTRERVMGDAQEVLRTVH